MAKYSMQQYLSRFLDQMDSENVKYTQREDNIVRVAYTGDNLETIAVFIIFDTEGEPLVQLKCWNIASFKGKEVLAKNVCNELNARFRWVKFYVDPDSDIIADLDAMIDIDTCGEECLAMVRRMVSIIDDAYPTIAKARWT